MWRGLLCVWAPSLTSGDSEGQPKEFWNCLGLQWGSDVSLTPPCLPQLAGPGDMRKFAYCKVVLATSLVWVMLDMFILLYFSECNKCDDKKERGLPGKDGESHTPAYTHSRTHTGKIAN